jgi:TonB family protein
MSFGFILPPEHVSRHHFRDPAFKRVFILSLSIHLVLLTIAGTATLFRMSGTSYTPSYTVDLITLPPSPAAKAKTSKAAVKTPKAETPKTSKVEKKPVVEARKEEVVKDSPFVTEPVKPRVGDEATSRERRKKLEDLEKQAASLYESYRTEEESVDRELPDGVASTGDQNEKFEDGAQGVSVKGLTGTDRGGPSSDIRFRAYYDRIWSQIRAAWVLPEGVAASEEDLLTVVGIRISTTGVIEDHWIEKGSGNLYYDQSALRAIRKASPLPPLPPDLDEESLEVGINFRISE